MMSALVWSILASFGTGDQAMRPAVASDPPQEQQGCLIAPAPIPDIHPTSGEVITKNIFVSFVAPDIGSPVAVRIRAVSLEPPYDVHNGTEFWVDEPFTVCENTGQQLPNDPDPCVPPPPPTPTVTTVAEVVCAPHCSDFAGHGIVHVNYQYIRPGSMYEVQVIDCSCDPADEASYSPPLEIPTARFGDVTGGCAELPCSVPDGQVNMTSDVLGLMDKFKNQPAAVTKTRGMLQHRIYYVGIEEVVLCLDAFRGFSYPFVPDDPPCTSEEMPRP